MGRTTSGPSTGALAGLTPLLDTLFLLLFALLAVNREAPGAPDKAEEEDVRIELPHVEKSPSLAPSTPPVVVLLDKEGTLRLQGETRSSLSLKDLDEALEQHLEHRLPEELPVEIRGDEGASLGMVLSLLQHLRLRGFRQVRMVARPLLEVDPEEPNRGSRP